MTTTIEKLRALDPKHSFHMGALSGRIYVEAEGFHISKPFVSECGREAVTPDYHGLSMEVALIMEDHNWLCQDPFMDEGISEEFTDV